MEEVKERHPSWFKLKLERRELVRELPPEVVVHALLACWEVLETGEKPQNLSPLERVAFAAFAPDLEEAWSRYARCVSNGATGGRPEGKNHTVPYAPKCPHTAQKQNQKKKQNQKQNQKAETDPPQGEGDAAAPQSARPSSPLPAVKGDTAAPKSPRLPFCPPTVEEVAAYVQQRGSRVDPQRFVDFYAAKGWMIGKTPMRDWKAACRNAEGWDWWQKPAQPGGYNKPVDRPTPSGSSFLQHGRGRPLRITRETADAGGQACPTRETADAGGEPCA